MKGREVLDQAQHRSARIYVESIEFSGGQTIKLTENSILVVVGPNNAGKSSVLREIRDHAWSGAQFGPVLNRVSLVVRGDSSAFENQILQSGVPTDEPRMVQVHRNKYHIGQVPDDFKKRFIGTNVMPLFVSYLGAEERLQLTEPSSRGEYSIGSPNHPMQWLEFDDDGERRVSHIFEQTFGKRLVLNTLAGKSLTLHLAEANQKGG
jgi:hypothetical protein